MFGKSPALSSLALSLTLLEGLPAPTFSEGQMNRHVQSPKEWQNAHRGCRLYLNAIHLFGGPEKATCRFICWQIQSVWLRQWTLESCQKLVSSGGLFVVLNGSHYGVHIRHSSQSPRELLQVCTPYGWLAVQASRRGGKDSAWQEEGCSSETLQF